MRKKSFKAFITLLSTCFLLNPAFAELKDEPCSKHEFWIAIGGEMPLQRFCSKDLPQRPKQTPVNLFDREFRNPLQSDTFMLMLANLPSQGPTPTLNHALLYTNKLPDGLGDYAYLHKTVQLINQRSPALKVDVMAEVMEQDIPTLTRIFQGDYDRYWAMRSENRYIEVNDEDDDNEPFTPDRSTVSSGSSAPPNSSGVCENPAADFHKPMQASENSTDSDTSTDSDGLDSLNASKHESFKPRIYRKGPEFSNLAEVNRVMENSGFTLFMAASPDELSTETARVKSNGFYIGEIINNADRLMRCDTNQCRKSQRLDFLNAGIEELALYGEVILGAPDMKDIYTSDHLEGALATLRMASDDPRLGQPSYEMEGYGDYLSVMHKHTTCSPTTHFTECLYAPQFGFGVNDVGFMHDTQLATKPVHSEHDDQPSWMKDLLTVNPELLAALAGNEVHSENIQRIAQGADYYLGYMKRLPGQLSFIQSVAKARPDAQLTFVMPVEDFELYRNEMSLGLTQANISTVKHWSADKGWQTVTVNSELEDGRTLKIINPFPLPQHQLPALIYFANSIVGSTGDHSMYGVISMGKLPFQELVEHQFFLRRNFVSLTDRPELKAFYRSSNPQDIAESIVAIEEHPEWIQAFTQSLIDEYSTNDLIVNIVETGVEPSQPIRLLLSSVDSMDDASDSDQEAFIQSLRDKEAEIARLRMIFNRIKKIEHSVDYLPFCPENVDKDDLIAFFKRHSDELKSTYLKHFLHEVISDFTIKFIP